MLTGKSTCNRLYIIVIEHSGKLRLQSATRSHKLRSTIMAVGVRTAPTVNILNITSSQTSLHLIDASGDKTTDTMITPDLVSDGLVEAWAAAYQAASQASLWKVEQTIVYQGDADASNAGIDQRNSIADGNNLLFKNISTLSTQTLRAVAPILAVMQGNQDIPLLGTPGYSDLIVAALAILAGFNMQSAQFTGRRERKNNPRIVT